MCPGQYLTKRIALEKWSRVIEGKDRSEDDDGGWAAGGDWHFHQALLLQLLLLLLLLLHWTGAAQNVRKIAMPSSPPLLPHALFLTPYSFPPPLSQLRLPPSSLFSRIQQWGKVSGGASTYIPLILWSCRPGSGRDYWSWANFKVNNPAKPAWWSPTPSQLSISGQKV